jgi:cell division protein FtsI (penicillin-binding protein 3)
VPPVKNKSSQRRRKTFQKNMGVDDKIYPTEFIWLLHSSLVIVAITIKLTNIQWVDGDYYRKLAKERTVRNL